MKKYKIHLRTPIAVSQADVNEFERQLYEERWGRDGHAQQAQQALEARQQAEARAAAAEQRAADAEAAASAAYQQRCVILPAYHIRLYGFLA